MKKGIFISIISLTLIISFVFGNIHKSTATVIETRDSSKYQEDFYIDKDIKEVISEINNLRDKYKDNIEEDRFDSLYIDVYEKHYEILKNIEFNNRNFRFQKQYFNDLVEILDRSIALGLKDFVEENKKASNDYIIKKIGRTVVFVEGRGDSENYISIKLNLLDIKNEKYDEIFSKVSDDKYILDNIVVGGQLNLIDFVNANRNCNYYDSRDIKIRYNMFFEGENLEKINILLEGKKGMKLKEEDIEVFINLLNILDLNAEEKGQLIEEYKNIFEKKSNKKISLENYNLNIDCKKGNISSSNSRELRYFSIEKNK